MQYCIGYDSPGDQHCTSSGSVHFSLSDVRSTGRCSVSRRSNGESRIYGILEDSPLWKPSKVDNSQIPLPSIEFPPSKNMTIARTPNSADYQDYRRQLISSCSLLNSELPMTAYQGALVPGYPNNFRLPPHALLPNDHSAPVQRQCSLSESIPDFTSSPYSESEVSESRRFVVILKYRPVHSSNPPSPLPAPTTRPVLRARSRSKKCTATLKHTSVSKQFETARKKQKSVPECKVSKPMKLVAWRSELSGETRPTIKKARRENCCVRVLVNTSQDRAQDVCHDEQDGVASPPPVLPKAGIFVNGKVTSIICLDGKTDGPSTSFKITDTTSQLVAPCCAPASPLSSPSPAKPECTHTEETRQGCWTCKLRRKKCDGARPICGECARLNIECYGYSKEKPSFITNPGEGEQMRRRFKLQIQRQKKINVRKLAKARHKKKN